MSVLYYPQLAGGSLAQYPVSRSWSKAAIVNTLPGGSTVLMPSPTPPRVTWQLKYSGLSDADWGLLQALFVQVGGQLGAFTLLDPTDNLLSWSEDFTANTWERDPLIQISTGVNDPMGGTSAMKLSNTGQAAQQVSQSVAGPSWYQYCFSVYLRADGPCTVNLVRSTASSATPKATAVGTGWTSFSLSGNGSTHEDSIRFGIQLPPGTSVYAFGAQLEAQPSAGQYKRKTDQSGVYANCRFAQDSLIQTADAAGQYSTTIQLKSNY